LNCSVVCAVLDGHDKYLVYDCALNAPFNFLGYAGGLWVLAHVVNGSLILAIGLLIIYFSYETKDKLVFRLSVLAIAFAISAIANGTLFLEIVLIPPLRPGGRLLFYGNGYEFSVLIHRFLHVNICCKKAQKK
jgi:hypothetical protein